MVLEEHAEIGRPCHCAGLLSLKGLINREIKAQKEFLVGRVLTIRELKPGDPLNGDKRVW